METNSASANDGPDTEVTDLRELMRRIHAQEVRAGSWDFIDPKYPENGPMIAPMLVDNQQKIIELVAWLSNVAKEKDPQNSTGISVVIYALLDFCEAHHIDIISDLNSPL